MDTTLDTRRLLRRTKLTRQGVTILAWLEGATHRLTLDDRTITFYRRVNGAYQVATAFRDDSAWSLSAWALRSVARLPATAVWLPKPKALVNRVA
jgi:hypothetical protein